GGLFCFFSFVSLPMEEKMCCSHLYTLHSSHSILILISSFPMRFLLFSLFFVFVSSQLVHWTSPDRPLTPIHNPNLGKEVNNPVGVAADRQLKGRKGNPNLRGFVDIPVV
ncbi:hypothetical protein PMAYCL1PPCAC_29632, partial [Pristionchus mayeri]